MLVSWIPPGKFWMVAKFFGGKRKRKKKKEEKKGEKGNFLRFPQKFLNAKNFPVKIPMLKISPLISLS